MTHLSEKRCLPCEGGIKPLDQQAVVQLIEQLDGWRLERDDKTICKDFLFQNFDKTLSFVNVVAWVANHQNHHPELEVGYGHCLVRYWTHAIDGLSENDFICAAKIDALF